ncbi:hypothetical protein G653_02178 [Candidatus Liberibacter americanus PW_SP]|nr:hypothetical protein G653_02178 [Candidatus Liberibacter americanus PW_SP]
MQACDMLFVSSEVFLLQLLSLLSFLHSLKNFISFSILIYHHAINHSLKSIENDHKLVNAIFFVFLILILEDIYMKIAERVMTALPFPLNYY